MAVLSFWQRTDQGLEAAWSLANYAKFLDSPAYLEAALNSLEITVMVTVLSVAAGLSACLDHRRGTAAKRWRRLALALAVRAVLDLLRRALLRLVAGAGAARRAQRLAR